eukprot:6051552-Lingulodinium_polyedra.AAC.1
MAASRTINMPMWRSRRSSTRTLLCATVSRPKGFAFWPLPCTPVRALAVVGVSDGWSVMPA